MSPAVTANATPTKSLILEALTTDIDLTDAILDLLDNSIDGIRRLDKKSPRWTSYSIAINFNKRKFTIADNCGGIEAATARDYAFRFGRPADKRPEQGLLGIYGVGMKRAIFKMGDRFKVTSATNDSRFEIDEDLESWRQDENKWTFTLNTFEESIAVPHPEIGTTIEISKLFDGISQEFQNPLFESDLMKKAAKAHRNAVSEGLRVTVNDKPLQTAGFNLLKSEAIQPGHATLEHNGSASPVKVLMFAGISESRPKEAGWYVFCNGRMVLEADQTSRTVWGEAGDVSIPKIHNQFSRFRGYAFFDCDEQKRLPWTSTKSGIDLSSAVYRKARQRMIETTRPVITFLNELDKEKEAESRPRHDAIQQAHLVALSDLSVSEAPFRYSGMKKTGPEMGRIAFQRPKERIEKAKERLDVSSNKEVGEKTFDYWYKYEVGRK